MGCNSSYMDPTAREVESKRAATLLRYVYQKLGMPVPQVVEHAAEELYGDETRLNEFVVNLCALLSGLPDAQKNVIIYDGRSKLARDLADWWDVHQEADRERIAKEAMAQRKEALKASARAKLTPEEWAAITDN